MNGAQETARRKDGIAQLPARAAAAMLVCPRAGRGAAAAAGDTRARARAGVCKACFSGEASRQGRAMAECRAAFVADLDPAAPGFPATLGALAGRLKAWRALLQATCEDSLPASLRLQDESRVLQARARGRPPPPGLRAQPALMPRPWRPLCEG
jgi:hypothetical protein